MIQVIRHEEGSETRSRRKLASGEVAWPVTAREVAYLVINAASKRAAFEAVLADSPEEEEGLIRQDVRFDGFTGDDAMEFSVIYEEPDGDDASTTASEENEPQMSFDCSGGTSHIVRSRKQRCWKTDPNPGGMIGWNGKTGQEAEFAGVDVFSATMRETYTLKMKPSKLTTAYKRSIANLTGTVNSKAFMGWEAGEVLFLGASFSGAESGSDEITVTFNFAIQQNEAAVPISGTLTINKRGWEYLWTITKTVDDPNTKTTRVEVVNAFVEEVYPYADFGQLKL